MLLVEAVNLYLDDYLPFEQRRNKQTIRAIRVKLNRFVFIVGNKNLTEINTHDCRSLIRDRLDANVEARTANKYLSALKGFFDYCELEGWIDKNPASRLKGLREPRRIVVALTKGEVYQIINHRLPYRTAKKRLWARDHLLMLMIAATGMRPNEISSLTWNCINFEEQYIWVKPEFGKGEKERKVVMINELASHLFHVWKRENPKPNIPLFPDIFHPGKSITARTINGIFKKMLKDIGITRFEPRYQRVYLLRKSYITHLIKDGVSIQSVSSLAGHANASTTWRYYVAASEFEEIKDEVMDKFYLNHTPKSNELEEYQKGLTKREGYVIKKDMPR